MLTVKIHGCLLLAVVIHSLAAPLWAESPEAVSRREDGTGSDPNLLVAARDPDRMIGKSGLQNRRARRSMGSNFILKRLIDPEMESDGKIPVWIGSDGRMLIPPQSLRSISHAKARPADRETTDLWSDSHQHLDQFRALDGPMDVETLEMMSGLSSDPRTAVPLSTSKNLEDATACSSCRLGMMSPYITNANGSDIFLNDIYSPAPPDRNTSQESLCSESDQFPGCRFTDYPDCNTWLVCTNTSFSNIVANLPKDLVSFEMNETEVNVLGTGVFRGLNVVSMKLASNHIRHIFHGAFEGIGGLQFLSVDFNQIRVVDWGTTFSGLDSLLILHLKNNLINMTSLGTENRTNMSGRVLPALVYLNLANNPLDSLNEFIFAPLARSPLRDLNLQSCNLRFIHPNAFKPLTSLRHVDLFNNPELGPTLGGWFAPPLFQLGLGLNELTSVPGSILQNVNQTLTILNLSGNFLYRLTEQTLPVPLANLAALVLDNCGLFSIESNAFRWTPSLKYLYLGKNQLTQIGFNVIPTTLNVLSIRQNPTRISGPGSSFHLNAGALDHMDSLTWLDMNAMNLETIESDAFRGPRNLQILQLRDSKIRTISPGSFRYLGNLFVLDLGQNADLTTLPGRFSSGLDNLTILFLDHCSIDFPETSTAGSDGIDLPFVEMSKLFAIFLNNNNIRRFDPALIATNYNLYLLELSYNKMRTWMRNTTQFMTNTSVVSAARNLISYLPDGIYDEFSSVLAVDLSDNAFICSCQCKDLQRLAADPHIVLMGWSDPEAYKCTDTSTAVPQSRMIQNMSESDFNCLQGPQTEPPEEETMLDPLSYVVPLVALVALTASVGGCYHKRRDLAHAWFTFRHLPPLNRAQVSPSTYQYDAFISFNAKDRDWVYTHLVARLEGPRRASFKSDQSGDLLTDKLSDPRAPFKLCIHDRDFTAGNMIAENIHNNISKSRKVIIVMSRAYCQSNWCQYELKLAHHRLTDENRDALVLILLEEVPKNVQNDCLKYLMRTRTYLAWRCDVEGQKQFWKQLVNVLTAPDPLATPVS